MVGTITPLSLGSIACLFKKQKNHKCFSAYTFSHIVFLSSWQHILGTNSLWHNESIKQKQKCESWKPFVWIYNGVLRFSMWAFFLLSCCFTMNVCLHQILAVIYLSIIYNITISVNAGHVYRKYLDYKVKTKRDTWILLGQKTSDLETADWVSSYQAFLATLCGALKIFTVCTHHQRRPLNTFLLHPFTSHQAWGSKTKLLALYFFIFFYFYFGIYK